MRRPCVRFRAAPSSDHGGFALLTTLLLLALLIAVVGQLAATTAMSAAAAKRRHASLAHELAVDSVLAVLPDRLTAESPLVAQLDIAGRASMQLDLDGVVAVCTITDDATKLDPNRWPRPDQGVVLARKLRALGDRRGLPGRVEIKPVSVDSPDKPGRPYHGFDQLVADADPMSLMPWGAQEGESPTWSDVVTLWGDGRIALRRADPEILDIVLEDIRPGLGRALLADRPRRRDVDFVQTALIRVDAELRQRVAERITFDARRYALAITTIVGGDRRHWYVVAGVEKGRLTVLQRSQVTW